MDCFSRISLALVFVCAQAALGADKGLESVAGVFVFGPKVTVEKAAEIGKKLGDADANFVRLTALSWSLEKMGGGDKASALQFTYMKKNDKFIAGKELGKTIKKKIEAEYGDIVRAWQISEGAVEIK